MAEEGVVDLAACSALVDGYVRSGRAEEALGVLYDMLEQHGQAPPVSLLGRVARALERDGLVQPGSLGPLFTSTFADIRRELFRAARLRGQDRDTAFRHLNLNRFIYFHLALFARPSPASSASFLRSFLSRMGIGPHDEADDDGHRRGASRRSGHSASGSSSSSSGINRREEVDKRAQMILQCMEEEGVHITGTLRQLLGSLTSSSPNPL